MEATLVERTELVENKENINYDKDGGDGSASGGKSKRAKNGASSNDFGKPGKSFDPDTILLVKKPQLTAKDVECSICWNILYEPTTLPCNHSLCLACFLQHAEETSLYCPLCRRRLSIWSRRAKKKNELLDKDLWERLKNEFSEQIAARENDDSQEVPVPRHEESQRSGRDGVISDTPGAIFDELKKVIKPHEEDLEKQRREAEAASLQLIQKLQEEERKKLEIYKKTEDEDFRLAKSLQEEYLRNNRGDENKARKSGRARVPCSFLNDYYCSRDSDVRRKSGSKNKILASRKITMNSGESVEIRVDQTADVAVANDDFHLQGASLEPMETEISDHHDRSRTSTAAADVCLLEQRPGPSLEMETENDNHAESIMPVVHLTTISLLEQTQGSSSAAKETECSGNHDKFTTAVPSTNFDLPEQQPCSSMEARKAKFNDDYVQSAVSLTNFCLPEQSPVSSIDERKTEINENNDQSTVTVINVNFDLTEFFQDIMQQNLTQDDNMEIVDLKPESDPNSEEWNSETIQCDVPMSALRSWTSKGFDLSGLSSNDEIIPPSDNEDDGEPLRQSYSGLALCSVETAAGSDDEDRMSSIIDYEVEEAEAAAWDAYRKRLEQEAEDRAYAMSLQRDINLGIDSNRSRRKESENKYGLRTWTRSGKNMNNFQTVEH